MISRLAYTPEQIVVRPNDAIAYTAGDVVGGLIPLTGLPDDAHARLRSIDFMLYLTAVPAGMTTFTIHLYRQAPVAIADNAAWSLAAADRAGYLTSRLLPAQALFGVNAVYAQDDTLDKVLRCGVGGSLWAYLVTTAGYTPAALTSMKLRLGLQEP